MDVELTHSEILLAYTMAGQIQAQNLTVERKPRYGADDNNFHSVVIGCLGELAVAKALNRFWSGNLGNLKAKDVGGIQVRASDRHNSLILHHPDADDDRFIFVRLFKNRATLAGWTFGRDGKKECYWRDDIPRPAFFIPSEKLNPMKGGNHVRQ